MASVSPFAQQEVIQDGPVVPLAVTQWSTDPSSHRMWPRPHLRLSYLLTRPAPLSPNPPPLTFVPAPAAPSPAAHQARRAVESQPRCWKPPRPETPGKKGPAAPGFLGSGQGPHFTLCPVPRSWEGSMGSVPGGKRQRSPSWFSQTLNPSHPRASYSSECGRGKRQPQALRAPHKHQSLLGPQNAPECVCAWLCLPESKRSKGPRKPQDCRPLHAGLTCPLTAHRCRALRGDPMGNSRGPRSATQYP